MNQSRIIIIVVATLIVIGLILAVIFGRKEGPGLLVGGDILVWGVFDDSDVIQNFIVQFQQAYPGVKITYQKKSIETYEKDLINALAAGRGPDIFYIHNTWLPKHIDKLTPIPADYMTTNDFKDVFVDVTYDDFVSDDEIYTLPLYVDTLALFYNKDIFNSAGIANPPSTWEGLLEMVLPLTQKNESGNIMRSAIAIGTAKNVNRSPDILGLLMLQSGTQMFDEDKRQTSFNESKNLNGITYPSGQQALEFYTNFANPKKSIYTWNGQMPNSIDAFIEGKAAMMLNYYYQIENIRAKSPHLKFGVSLMPQSKGAKTVVNYANYWGLGVSVASKYTDVAWLFAYYLTDKDQASAYLKSANHPTARRDLVNEQRQDKELGIFAQQSLSAYSWYQPDSAAVDKIFEDMIESTVAGISPQSAISNAARKVDLLVGNK